MLRSTALLLLASLASGLHAQADGVVDEFHFRSELLSSFWGRDIQMSATVVLPPGFDKEAANPVCFNIHGFGGGYKMGGMRGRELLRKMESGYPRLVYVFLDGNCPLGHHVFADSVNNGPWGTALVNEFIPELELEFGFGGTPELRFLTGHSSGGWSSLWLQVCYPAFFNGTWSTSPDSVTFSDFSGIDMYSDENIYVDAEGQERPIIRMEGEVRRSLKEYAILERKSKPYGGQIDSFDAVFSPRAEDGRPMEVFDRETGVIDREVVAYWERYDILRFVRKHWGLLQRVLPGKVHVYMGLEDNFYLDGACELFKEEMAELGSDAEIILVPGRDHGSIQQPHPELWPAGMMERIHREMWERAKGGD